MKRPEEVAALAPLAKNLGFSVCRRKHLRGIRKSKDASLDQMALRGRANPGRREGTSVPPRRGGSMIQVANEN